MAYLIEITGECLWPGIAKPVKKTRIDGALYAALSIHYDVMDGLSLRDREVAWSTRRAIGNAFKMLQTIKNDYSQSIALAGGYTIRITRQQA